MAKTIVKGVKGVGRAIFGGGKKKAAAETPTMPMPNDEEVRRAKRRSLMKQAGRSGRSSTILTDGEG